MARLWGLGLGGDNCLGPRLWDEQCHSWQCQKQWSCSFEFTFLGGPKLVDDWLVLLNVRTLMTEPLLEPIEPLLEPSLIKF